MKTLNDLQHCRTIPALRSELYELCKPYGAIKRLDVLQSKHEGTLQAICFLRMGTPGQEAAVMHALGVGRFGGEIVLVVEVNGQAATEAAAGPSSQWTDWGAL
ncbi:MAG: RNA-binding protein [Comamonadaceae bacterium]|nr:MAG: RNA-binding protein [Comamonadaceae bacterium]